MFLCVFHRISIRHDTARNKISHITPSFLSKGTRALPNHIRHPPVEREPPPASPHGPFGLPWCSGSSPRWESVCSCPALRFSFAAGGSPEPGRKSRDWMRCMQPWECLASPFRGLQLCPLKVAAVACSNRQWKNKGAKEREGNLGIRCSAPDFILFHYLKESTPFRHSASKFWPKAAACSSASGLHPCPCLLGLGRSKKDNRAWRRVFLGPESGFWRLTGRGRPSGMLRSSSSSSGTYPLSAKTSQWGPLGSCALPFVPGTAARASGLLDSRTMLTHTNTTATDPQGGRLRAQGPADMEL